MPLRLCLACVIATLTAAAPVAAQTNVISTVAGTTTSGYSGDGGPATAAELSVPFGVSATPGGGYLIADQGNSTVRRVSPDGTITTVAGNGTQGFGGDGGPATAAMLNAPSAAVMRDGTILIADANNNRIREVGTDGVIRTVAGTGNPDFSGDNGPATSASLSFPADVASTPDGGYLIADADNNRIRKVSANGTMTTVAGTGAPGFAGDGGSATQAILAVPSSVSVTADSGFLIADTTNNRIRRVAPDGTITTVAGSGSPDYSGDGGPATAAGLDTPIRVAAMPDGGFLVADRLEFRVRRVFSDGTITTGAGTGTNGFSGDGGPAPLAQLSQPFGVAATAEGDYLIADTSNSRIRFVDAAGPPQPPQLPPPERGETANAAPVRGEVFVKLPAGSTRKQARRLGVIGAATGFVPLTEATQLPVGSIFNTEKGTVALTMAAAADGSSVQKGNFSRGRFVLRQRHKNPLTTLQLTGGGIKGCASGIRKKHGATAARKRHRSLFSNVHGRFRTRGRHATATVRGTKWTMTDTCSGTLTVVKSGTVVVRDLVKHRTRTLHKGQRYLAKPKKRKHRR